MALIWRRPCASGFERNRAGKSSPSRLTPMASRAASAGKPQRDAALDPRVDETALPGLAVRHDGDANVGGAGAGGARAASLRSQIDADAHRVSPRAVHSAQGGRMPAGRQAGRQFAVHVPEISAGVLQEDRMRTIGSDAREHIRGSKVRLGAFKPDRYVIVVRGGELAVAGDGVFHRYRIWRRLPRILNFRPTTV